MVIFFKTSKTHKIFRSQKSLIQTYGKNNAEKIINRMSVLGVAENLDQVPKEPPERCHQLTGNRDEQFAVDIDHLRRIIFEVNNEPIPRKEDNGIDLKKVTEIIIYGIEDYHD
jgi:toxin HigB-1